MTTKVETSTSEMAMDILEHHNPRNRTISEGTVSCYATDMKNDRWTLTHQGIAFDENGDLIDGQHRLWAVVFANKPVQFNVTRGIPLQQVVGGVLINSMDNIDRVRVRQTGHQLQLCHGVKNGTQVAAGLRGIGLMIYPSGAAKRLSTSNALFINELYGKDVEVIVNRLEKRHRVAHILAPLSIYHHGETQKALEFCTQLSTLENLSPAIRYLIRFLDNGGATGDRYKALRIVSKCVHAFHDGQTRCDKLQDDGSGIKFLTGMFPSMNRKIFDALKPVAGLNIRRNLNQKSLV